jgi:hypothetical protein
VPKHGDLADGRIDLFEIERRLGLFVAFEHRVRRVGVLTSRM